MPISCCKSPTSIDCGLRIHPSSISFTVSIFLLYRAFSLKQLLEKSSPQILIYFQGCVHPISHHIERRLLVFACASLGFSVLQVSVIKILLTVVSCCFPKLDICFSKLDALSVKMAWHLHFSISLSRYLAFYLVSVLHANFLEMRPKPTKPSKNKNYKIHALPETNYSSIIRMIPPIQLFHP